MNIRLNSYAATHPADGPRKIAWASFNVTDKRGNRAVTFDPALPAKKFQGSKAVYAACAAEFAKIKI